MTLLNLLHIASTIFDHFTRLTVFSLCTRNRYQPLTKTPPQVLYKMGFDPFQLTPFCTKRGLT